MLRLCPGHERAIEFRFRDPMAAPAAEPSVGVVIAALPEARANKDPLGACLTDDRGELDNAGFAAAVLASTSRLASAGLGPGDVLPLVTAPRIEVVTTMFAAWRLGVVAVPDRGRAPLFPPGDLARTADSVAGWYRMDSTTVSLSALDHLVPCVVAPLLAGGSVVLSDRLDWPTIDRARPTALL
jgi:acyl-CoA synthetase (AMP-forming)/AMP-acid ligase II